MNAVKKLVVLFSLGALAPFAASAKSPVESYLETCRRDAGVPVPVSVVAPKVANVRDGALVELAFTVDVTGQPVGISVKSTTDDTFAAAALNAVKQWKFAPATRAGQPVATNVVLPVRAVAPKEGSSLFAAL